MNPPAMQEMQVQSQWERSPGEGNGNPLQYSCLGNPMERGAQWAPARGVTRVGHDLEIKPLPPMNMQGQSLFCNEKKKKNKNRYSSVFCFCKLVIQREDSVKRYIIFNIYFFICLCHLSFSTRNLCCRRQNLAGHRESLVVPCGIQVPNHGSNLGPLLWELGIFHWVIKKTQKMSHIPKSTRLCDKLKTRSKKRKKSKMILKFQATRKMLLLSSEMGNTQRTMNEKQDG